jgi:hypothetical protein
MNNNSIRDNADVIVIVSLVNTVCIEQTVF